MARKPRVGRDDLADGIRVAEVLLRERLADRERGAIFQGRLRIAVEDLV